jgi:hypothetical protein
VNAVKDSQGLEAEAARAAQTAAWRLLAAGRRDEALLQIECAYGEGVKVYDALHQPE